MNEKLATILYELSVLYDLKHIAFKPRAFERASQAVSGLGESVADIYARDGIEGLERIPGVGRGIAERIEEFIRTKHIREYTRLKARLPVDISGILAIEGVGPKTLELLYRKLHVTTRTQLERYARKGTLASVRGIGPKGQDKILRAIGFLEASKGRFSPGLIWTNIRSIADRIESWPHVQRVELCGSLRRMQETIGDLDLLVISDDAADTLRRFVSMPGVSSVYSHGDRRALVRLEAGMDADLTVMDAESFGAALIGWTGNKAHNVHLRRLAKKRGMLLDDYGLFRGKTLIAGTTEEDVYRKLGMQFIPAELRSDSGEIEMATAKKLPALLGYGDLKGDLQVQTDWTDGQDSIATMAKAARAAGLEYIAITDHTQSLTVASGLDEQKIKKQWSEIDRVQKQVHGIKILKGSECDIRKDGSLDLDDRTLSQLDVVGASVHSHFDLSEAAQTERIVRALESPHVDILFHPTGRLIGRREPYRMDMHAVLACAKRTKTVVEANAHPGRLDLNDVHIKMAVDLGVRLSIDSDAHAATDYAYLRWGIGQARRGWTQKKQVVNTHGWQQMLALLK